MYSLRDLGEVITTTGKLLTFQQVVPDLKRLGPLYLSLGLISCCLAGIGRHWDNPRLGLWQHLGLDSVAYVFVFAGIVWLVLWPMKPSNWRYSTVLTFVALTSPPAFLYALPSLLVPDMPENQILHPGMHWSLRDAYVSDIKTRLLLVVACWRVALLARFLHQSAGLRGGEIVVATLLPLVMIVVALNVLNLDRAVFDFMGGRQTRTVDDGAYAFLTTMTLLSVLLFPVILLGYLGICWARSRRR